MSSFISSSGLAYLWSKIKEYISANTGTYSKPSDGIPKSDLASTVLASLDKADTALLSHQSVSNKNADIGTSLTTIATIGSTDIKAKITHQDISGKADKSATVSTVAYDTTNKKLTKTINGSTTDVVTAAKIVTDGGGITSHQDISGKADKSTTTTAGTYRSVTVNSSGIVTGGTNPTTLSGYGITDAKIASGTITLGSNSITPLTSYTETDPVFSASAASGITSSDITNWNNKTSNVGTITGIKMNGVSKGTSGVVDLGTVITAHLDISGKANLASPAFTGTPTAPTAAAGTSTTQIATTAFVLNELSGQFDEITGIIEDNEEVVSSALNDLNSRIENMVVEETDPTVPDWAKEPYPPTYLYYDVGALSAYSYVDGVGFNNGTTINHFVTCSTSASTTAKTASKANFQLSTGSEIIVKFTYTNTASNPTLNINSTGARSIYYNGTNIPASALAANRVYKFVYDGSYWLLVGSLGTTAEELINLGFLTDDDVVDEVNLEDKPVTSNAVYEYITEDEKVIASALNDLNTRVDSVEESVEDLEGVAFIDDDDTTGTLNVASANLGDLGDVTISNPTNNQGLIYNSSTGQWVNGTISGGGSGGGGDVNVIETVKVNGTALTPDSNKAVNISAVTSFNGSTGAVTYSAPVTSVNGNTGAVVLNIPAAVTESTVSGWGFTKNAGTITGVTGNNGLTGSGTSGSVTISHAAPSTSPAKTTSAVYPITIDLYGHITAAGSAVTIPTQVTESTVSGWGFTKNAGTITGVTGSNGLTGSGTSGSVTISHAAPSTAPTKTTSAVYPIKIDQYGHITAAGSAVTIPAAPGTLKTNNTTALTTSSSEALSGTINLHKVAKTGTYSDLIGTPTNVSTFTNDANYVTSNDTVAIYSGSSAPSSSLGKNGDIYILTT